MGSKTPFQLIYHPNFVNHLKSIESEIMKSVSLTKVKTNLNSYLKTCGREPVLVTKNGRPIAALIAVVDPDELERLQLANSPKLDAIFEKALNDIRHGRGLTHEEVWSQVESWPESSARKLPQSPCTRESPKPRRLS